MGTLRVAIGGRSMSPTIDVGDVVLVEAGAEPRVGEVAVFRTSAEPVCHRVVASFGAGALRRYLHRGDGSAGIGVFGRSACVGRVVARERGGRVELVEPQTIPWPSRAQAFYEWLASIDGGRVDSRACERDPERVGRQYDVGATSGRAAFESDPRTVERYRRMEESIRIAVGSATRVLDLGCGWGRLLDQLPRDGRVVGVDVSFESLRRLGRAGHPVVRADAHRLPFADRSFDVVVAANAVFRHLDAERALAECARVLRPGGLLFAHFYNARPIGLRSRADPSGLSGLDALDEASRRAGLSVERKEAFRAIRVRPYLLRVPAPIADRLFSHAILAWRA